VFEQLRYSTSKPNVGNIYHEMQKNDNTCPKPIARRSYSYPLEASYFAEMRHDVTQHGIPCIQMIVHTNMFQRIAQSYLSQLLDPVTEPVVNNGIGKGFTFLGMEVWTDDEMSDHHVIMCGSDGVHYSWSIFDGSTVNKGK